MSVTTTKYRLTYISPVGNQYIMQDGFDTESDAKEYALSLQDLYDQQYQIEQVTTIVTPLDAFTVLAYIPTWEEVAQEIADVYGCSVDYNIDAFNRLSAEDQQRVREYVDANTLTCDCCGHSYNANDLSHVSFDLIAWTGWACSDCESSLSEEEDDAAEADELNEWDTENEG